MPAVVSIVWNLTIIAAILLFRDSLGVSAIAWGMLVASELAVSRGLLPRDDRDALEELVMALGPLPQVADLPVPAMIKAMRRDKKVTDGTLHFVLPKAANVAVNAGILVLIVGSYIANRQGNFAVEKALVGLLILGMMVLVFYGVMSLRRNQLRYDSFHPEKPKDKDKQAVA